MDIKVVVEQRMLPGSNHPSALQRVATVYIDGKEYRVLAPGAARGDALEWVRHFSVRRPANDGYGGEYELSPSDATFIVKVVKEELENQNPGVHPDRTHCAAQICLKGDVLHTAMAHPSSQKSIAQSVALLVLTNANTATSLFGESYNFRVQVATLAPCFVMPAGELIRGCLSAS